VGSNTCAICCLATDEPVQNNPAFALHPAAEAAGCTGRYRILCSKTIIDFTAKSNHEGHK
jgi:hypothetical protein